jgi:hypothetical protein
MVFILPWPWALQFLQYITADAVFVCDKAAVNGDKIKGTLWVSGIMYTDGIKLYHHIRSTLRRFVLSLSQGWATR